MSDAVFVEAPARLHFGVLDLRGDLGRRFGGIGAAVPAPSLLLEARRAAGLKAEGSDAARALEFARRFARHHGLDLRLHFCLHRSIPPHAGRGSGTLPALAEADLAGFGAALEEVQRITGGWFAPAQGGVFAPGETGELVERLRAWGAVGVGQSSWGPAVYGIVGDGSASAALAERVRGAIHTGGLLYEGGFSLGGARVWRDAGTVSG